MKQILIAVTLLFIYAKTYSQVHIGLSSGATITKIRDKDQSALKQSSLTGFNIGLPILFKLNKNIGFESGLFYINMGSTEKINPTFYDPNDPLYMAQESTTYYRRFNYLSLPLTVNYIIPIKKYGIYAKAGGYFSYALNGNITNDQTDEKVKIDLNNGQINKSDVGMLFGLGATRELGKGYVFFETRYMLGCAKLNKSEFHLYNRGLLLNVGYIFNFGKS